MPSASFVRGAEADKRRRAVNEKSRMPHCARIDRRGEDSAIDSREKSWEEEIQKFSSCFRKPFLALGKVTLIPSLHH